MHYKLKVIFWFFASETLKPKLFHPLRFFLPSGLFLFPRQKIEFMCTQIYEERNTREKAHSASFLFRKSWQYTRHATSHPRTKTFARKKKKHSKELGIEKHPSLLHNVIIKIFMVYKHNLAGWLRLLSILLFIWLDGDESHFEGLLEG